MIAAQRFDEDLKSWHLCAAIASAANMYVGGRCRRDVERTKVWILCRAYASQILSATHSKCKQYVVHDFSADYTHTHTHTHTQSFVLFQSQSKLYKLA